MNQLIIAAQGITKSFGKGTGALAVLRGIDAVFKQGTTYAITGVSGTGKSTLLHLLAGLDEPTKGKILYNNRALSTLRAWERTQLLQKSVGLVFQSPHLISELSVQENVMLPALIAGAWRFKARKKAWMLLGQLGIDDKADAHPATLSGGQQQRVALARALMNKPLFLLADEPTGNLDAKTGNQIVDLICECQKQWGMGVIITSHDAYVAQSMHKVFVVREGRLHPRVS